MGDFQGFGEYAALITLLTPILMGVVQAAKSAGMDSRWAGLASIAIGAVVGALYALSFSAAIPPTIFVGAVSGLSAAGLYSAGKAITEDR